MGRVKSRGRAERRATRARMRSISANFDVKEVVILQLNFAATTFEYVVDTAIFQYCE